MTGAQGNGDPAPPPAGDEEELERTAVAGRDEELPGAERPTPTGRLRWRSGREVLGHRIVCKLGKGAVGAVYLAETLEGGERRALKVVPNPSSLERTCFEREARIQRVAGIHPNVARLLDAGEVDGHLYLFLEYLPGGSLRERVRYEGPLPVPAALAVAAEVAAGLGAVHAEGALHRDLKPANVMFDEEDHPKLVDFGLAGGRDDLQRGDLPSNLLQGTPAFMAPEQLRSDQGLDARTDVYGLGATLYYALTGTCPYEECESLSELISVSRADPEPPSARAPAQEIPPEVDALVLKALAREPEQRFASAAELEAALRALLPPE